MTSLLSSADPSPRPLSTSTNNPTTNPTTNPTSKPIHHYQHNQHQHQHLHHHKPQKTLQLDVERITRAWRALMAYRGLSLQVFDTQALSFQALGEARQAMIPTVPIRLSHAAEAAEHNADLLERVATLTGIDARFDPLDFTNAELEATVHDFPDVVDTLLAITRDWSKHGAKERARVYDRIVAAVQEAAEDAISTATASATVSSALQSRLSMHDYDLDHKHDVQLQQQRHLEEQQQLLQQQQQPQHQSASLDVAGVLKSLPSLLRIGGTGGGGGVREEQQGRHTHGQHDRKNDDINDTHSPDPRHARSRSAGDLGMMAAHGDDGGDGDDLDASMDNFIRAESELNEVVAHDVISNFCVLVVGASLGRLAWELARLGFSVQGVERSYLQLFTANFIMNGLSNPDDALHLYPFVHHTGLVATADDQLREVQFPDTDPRQLHSAHADFSMVAGEFTALYHEASAWDCVVTCFSLENCANVLSTVRRIAHVLKPGGVWVNQGSLDFRYEENSSNTAGDSQADANDGSDVAARGTSGEEKEGETEGFEVTQEELDFVIARCGLRVLRRETVQCKPPYFVSGMVDEVYQSMFFVAVKV